MKKLILTTVLAIVGACSNPTEEDISIAAAEVTSLNETSWSFVMEGNDIFESIDSQGNYIANAGDTHFDHGTYALIDGSHCFTSAMNDEGQICWETPAYMEVGQSYDLTNDRGDMLTVTREEYQSLSM